MDVTIRDIARECGVSVSSVSRALNNHPDISPKTREKIMKVIREKGFVPNDSARNMRRSETNNIALLIKGTSNLFFSEMLPYLTAAFEKKGYSLILHHVGYADDEVSAAQSLVIEKKLKGIVFLGGRFDHGSETLRDLGVPIVFCTVGAERSDFGGIRCAHVCVDDVKAAEAGTEYLISLGHRDIAVITENLDVQSVGQFRVRGYREALEKHHIPYRPELVLEISGGQERYSPESGYEAAKRLLRSGVRANAVFCISDVLAIGAGRAILDEGLRIPEDISVLGFDGIEMGNYVNPRLTTVRQPIREIAEKSIEQLLAMIEGGTGTDLVLETKIVERASTGKRNETGT